MASQPATTKGNNDVEQQKTSLSVKEKSNNSVLNNFGSFRGRIAIASMREAELVSGVSAASNQKERTTVELRQACNTISMQTKSRKRLGS